MSGNQIIYFGVLAFYLIGMLILGFITSKKTKDSKSYYTSDRSMNAAVTGFSFSATQMSSGSMTGTPATVSDLGYGYAATSVASAASPLFSFLMVGERIRKICERVDAVDMGGIFRARYGKSGQIVFSFIVLIFFTPQLVAQLVGAGTLMNTLFGLDYKAGILLLSTIIVIYTALGGMSSVAWTDYIQGIIMIVGTAILLGACLINVGGFSQMNARIAAIAPEKLALTGTVTKTWLLCGVFTWSFLQIGGNPSCTVRFLIPKDVKTLRKAFGYSVCFQSFIFLSLILIGLCGIVLVPNLENPDRLVATLTGTYLHPILGAILVSAIIAAVMSTVDSGLLLCSSIASNNIYKSYINPNADLRSELRVGRITTIVIGVAAVLIAFKPFALISWMSALTFNAFASAFTFPLLLGVWWKRCSKAAGTAGMVSGLAAALIWYALGLKLYGSWSNWPFGIWPGIVGITVSGLAMVITTMCTAPPSQDIVDAFYLE